MNSMYNLATYFLKPVLVAYVCPAFSLSKNALSFVIVLPFLKREYSI